MKISSKSQPAIAFLALIVTLLFLTFSGQKAEAKSMYIEKNVYQKTNAKDLSHIEATPTIAPVLPSAPYGTIKNLKKNPPPIIPGSASPTLQGKTNGTIGPPGPDATMIRGMPTAGTIRINPLLNIEKLLVACLFLISIATCGVVMFRRNRPQKNSLWVNSAIAAVVLMVAGFLMGHLFNFSSTYNDSIISSLNL